MPIAVDFAWDHPTIDQLHQAGVVLVIRYLTGGEGKAMTPAEFQSYMAANPAIVVVFVFELEPTDSAGGRAAGIANATAANAALNALGVDLATSIVYFAVDESTPPADAVPYFQGINSMRPASQTGIYGEGALCQLLQQDGLAEWFWQSESTSFPGNSSTLAITHIQQTTAASPLAGTDLDILCKADVGQWPRPVPVDPPPVSPPPAPVPQPTPGTPGKPIEVDMTLTPYAFNEPCDSNGDGWIPVPYDDSTIIAIKAAGPNPPTTGYWVTPRFSTAEEVSGANKAVISWVGGPLSGQVGFTVWVAS